MGRKIDPWLYPLPRSTMEEFVRRLFAPIEKGQSLVLLFEAKAGRRALSKFLIANFELFRRQIKKGVDHYSLYFIDPPEMAESSPLGYISLFYYEMTGCPPPLPSQYFDVFARVKEAIQKKVKEKELVFFLNQFDEIPFMDKTLANNLKALWQVDKNRVHYVFLPFDNIATPETIENYGELRETIMENVVRIPPLSEEDMEYIIARQGYFLGHRFSPPEIKAIKKISGGNPYIIKTACRIINQNKTTDPQSFLEQHYQIQLLKEEERGANRLLTINPKTGAIVQGEKPIPIRVSGKEYDLLITFLQNKGIILSRDKIADVLWGRNSFEKYSDWAIDQAIHQLRAKLALIGAEKNLETLRGKGYRYKDL